MPRLSIPFLLLAVFCAAGARADIYGYTDDAGTLVLSDVKTDNRYALLLKTEIGKQPALATSVSGARINWANQKRYAPLVADAARAYHLDEALLHAVISTESGYDAEVVSPKGAIGLMQVMPETGRRYGAPDLTDPIANIRAGARYLHDLLNLFHQDLKLALAAYNAGENAVLRHGNRIPPYRETAAYVPRVLALYARFRGKT